jgi:phenylpropionate dioxygenase-like ring-hydroxylating dioxygenase large terminal subunit
MLRSTTLPPRIERLLDEMDDGLERGEVPLSIYGDPEIYALELERVFARCWNFLAHESEIPNPGDYVLRFIADTPLIVTRDANGRVNVLFDSCRHRGPRLCPADRGNTLHFRCAYHGWTYQADGALVGVPNRAECYPHLRTEEWGLLKPRMANYQGLIFACLDERTESFEEYLGDFRWYTDVHFAPGNRLEVVGGPLRWVLPGNWKSMAENFAGDSYHTRMLHRSVADAGLGAFTAPRTRNDVHVTHCGGHATSAARVGPDEVGFWGHSADYAEHYRGAGLSPAQLEFARSSNTGQGTIFPNASFIHAAANDAPGNTPSPYLSLALGRPKSPAATEIWRWVFAPSWYTAEQKARAHQVAFSAFGPAGNAEQDDSVVWSGTTASGASLYAKLADAKLNYTMGLDLTPMRDFPGPGVVYDQRLEDGVQRTVLRSWLDRMRAE